MGHSPEPWTQKMSAIIDAKSRVVLEIDRYSDILAGEDIERIVACVNACRGIPAELLQRVGSGELEFNISAVNEPMKILVQYGDWHRGKK